VNVPEQADKAFAAVLALRKEADKLEWQAVEMAIADGWSWSQIAQAMGVSKQAAHKRYAKYFKQEK